MKVGSMEAFIGADHNMKMTDKPIQVYKEAKDKGDTAAMLRAMGCVVDFEQRAKDCCRKIRERIGPDLRAERAEQDSRREQAIRRYKEQEKCKNF